MSSYIEKAEEVTLPVIPLRATVAFPSLTLTFEPGDEAAVQAAKAAGEGNSFIFLTAYHETSAEDGENDPYPYYRVGTIARIKQMIRTPEGDMRIIAEGAVRAMVIHYRKVNGYVEADLIAKHVTLRDNGGVRGEAGIHEMLTALEKNASYLPANSEDMINAARLFDDPGRLADFIASNVLVRNRDKQAVLECFDPFYRVETLLEILATESLVLRQRIFSLSSAA